ncbi:hypothetical protein NECID01_1357 [Nematocida sp. AWRm77]|nr:hypothetical protein NECID01_1357 [Nematocida sp. AWRm77]
MDESSKNWRLKASYEYSYFRILESIFQNISVEIEEDAGVVLAHTNGETMKGPVKAVLHFLQSHSVAEPTLKCVSDVIMLRPQQSIAYQCEEDNNDIDMILAIAKIRKCIAEGYFTSKISEGILEKLCAVHEKYQEIFCRVTREKLIPTEKFKSIIEFYKAVVLSGTIESIIDHPEADNLYIENVEFKAEKRTIVSGLKGKFEKDKLLNRSCLFMVNLKPTAFKGIKSFGMILFARDAETGAGSVVFTDKPGERASLLEYPFESLIPFPIKVGDCSKKTLDSFFSLISVEGTFLVYNGMSVGIGGQAISIPDIKNGTIS